MTRNYLMKADPSGWRPKASVELTGSGSTRGRDRTPHVCRPALRAEDNVALAHHEPRDRNEASQLVMLSENEKLPTAERPSDDAAVIKRRLPFDPTGEQGTKVTRPDVLIPFIL